MQDRQSVDGVVETHRVQEVLGRQALLFASIRLVSPEPTVAFCGVGTHIAQAHLSSPFPLDALGDGRFYGLMVIRWFNIRAGPAQKPGLLHQTSPLGCICRCPAAGLWSAGWTTAGCVSGLSVC